MIGQDQVDQGPSKSEILFEYRWLITRELDRINRSTQGFTSLDARIAKLRALAEPFIWKEDKDRTRRVAAAISDHLEDMGVDVTMGELVPVFVQGSQGSDWATGWQRITNPADPDVYANRHDLRWNQLRHLVRLFHARGVFLEDDVPVSRLAFQEWDHP